MSTPMAAAMKIRRLRLGTVILPVGRDKDTPTPAPRPMAGRGACSDGGNALVLLLQPAQHIHADAFLVQFADTGLGNLVNHGYLGRHCPFVDPPLLDEGLQRSEEHTSELQSREKLVCW